MSDAQAIDNLIGTRLVFGLESDIEARGALELVRLDPEDVDQRRRLLGFRHGRCMMRDLDDRLAAIQIAPPGELLRRLDTAPAAASEIHPAA
jgi:AAA-like domain